MAVAAAATALLLPDADEIIPEELGADVGATAASGDGCTLPAGAEDGGTAEELADVVILFADT